MVKKPNTSLLVEAVFPKMCATVYTSRQTVPPANQVNAAAFA
jgi:hypothetical protein